MLYALQECGDDNYAVGRHRVFVISTRHAYSVSRLISRIGSTRNTRVKIGHGRIECYDRGVNRVVFTRTD